MRYIKDFSAEQNNVRKIIVRGKNKLIFNQLQLPLKLTTIKQITTFFRRSQHHFSFLTEMQ